MSTCFRAASEVRGERVIHAKGAAFDAQLEILSGTQALGVPLVRRPWIRPAVVRFSRGAGFPDAVPDVLGLAVRVPNADGAGGVQDLLLATSAHPRVIRRLLVPRRDLLRSTYSSLVSYEVGGRRLVVGTCPEDPRGARGYDELPGRALLLATAEPAGAWEPFARLAIGPRLPDDRELEFDLRNDAGGFVLSDALRSARVEAYPAARSAESEHAGAR